MISSSINTCGRYILFRRVLFSDSSWIYPAMDNQNNSFGLHIKIDANKNDKLGDWITIPTYKQDEF